MKSWISFFLPDDEYKKKRMLYFLSEGSVILMFSLTIMMIFSNSFHLDAEISLLLPAAVFLVYVLGRYALSGIEYADIATEGAYKKELKHIFVRTGKFLGIYLLLYIAFIGIPSSQHDWVEMIGLILSISLLWFFVNYISLKRSYYKNKELL